MKQDRGELEDVLVMNVEQVKFRLDQRSMYNIVVKPNIMSLVTCTSRRHLHCQYY